MNTQDQQNESYLPVYDAVPEKWEAAKPFFVEVFKKISDMVNIREIGWVLEDELLTGKNFQPSATFNQQFRSIFRKLIPFSPLAIGVNSVPHGITFDSNFTLIQIYGAATNSGTLIAVPIPGGSMTVTMDATNVNVTSPAVYDRAWIVIEYILEV